MGRGGGATDSTNGLGFSLTLTANDCSKMWQKKKPTQLRERGTLGGKGGKGKDRSGHLLRKCSLRGYLRYYLPMEKDDSRGIKDPRETKKKKGGGGGRKNRHRPSMGGVPERGGEYLGRRGGEKVQCQQSRSPSVCRR